jgi:Holliday junction resolvase RusA-like endonuclease
MTTAAKIAEKSPLDCPIVLQVEFVQRRPTSAPKRSTPSATGAPDLSKLVRSTEDAITSAGVWRDDSRIIVTLSSKRIAEIDEIPGARIRIGVPA